MFSKNIIYLLLLIKAINCISTEFVSYNSYNLILKTNIINKNNSFKFLIDTGSSDTWIPGVQNINDTYINYYDISKINEKPIENKTITYNSNARISFSKYSVPFYINDISINNFLLGITNVTQNFLKTSDGILALGGFIGNYEFINEYKKNILTYKMVKQGIIENNIFSLYINNSNLKYGELNMKGGKLIFGNKTDDNIKYKNIKSYNVCDNSVCYFWKINLTKLNIEGINGNIEINNKAGIDTGTASIVFNKTLCDIIHNKLGGRYDYSYESYIFDNIDNIDKLKNISIYINNDEFILTPDDYTFKNKSIIQSKIIINNNSGIILGLPLIQKYYTIYDFDNRKISIAEII